MGWKEICKVIVPVVFSTFALITSLLYGFWCESVEFHPINDNLPVLRFSPWYREIYTVEIETNGGDTNLYVRQGCAAFVQGTPMDSKWKAARAFTVMTTLFGGLLCLMLWFSLCMNFASEAVWKKLGMIVIFFMVLFQGLTFIFLRSNLCDGDILKVPLFYDTQCKWSGGSTNNVVSIVLWFWTGAAMMILGPRTTTAGSDDANIPEVESGAVVEDKQAAQAEPNIEVEPDIVKAEGAETSQSSKMEKSNVPTNE